MVSTSLLAAVPASALVAVSSVRAGLALFVGVGCGVLNALLTMRSNERLLDHRGVAAFVLSSVLRIVVFGIVPVGLALGGPWWTMAVYFAGFFTPLALFALSVARTPQSNSQ
ncbi:MAG: hypothetical protein JO043_03085 [Candidatus Eremiobacteraeota bacterium]|nr:hypothetical protein [Candidatus Eremiobacteraeota bacterium]